MRSIKAQTSNLVEELKNTPEGELVTYESLMEISKTKNVISLRCFLYPARSVLLEDYAMIFECVKNVGIKRTKNGEIPKIVNGSLRKINSECVRGARRGRAANIKRMTKEEQVSLYAGLTLLAAYYQTSLAPSLAAIEGKIAETHKTLPVHDTLRFLSEAFILDGGR